MRDQHGNIVRARNFIGDALIDCERCGDFIATDDLVDDWPAHARGDVEKSLIASNVIRAMQKRKKRTRFDLALLESLIQGRGFASVGEAANAMIRFLGDELRNTPGNMIVESWKSMAALLELARPDDVYFITDSLEQDGFIRYHPKLLQGGQNQPNAKWTASLTLRGWRNYEHLKLSEPASRFAFFARKFDNPELDRVFRECLEPAVKDTGYELRTVTQKAGLIDAIIEDEIRRCRFMLADLSDDNAGAYWEAGLAEGLRKPVIYVCRDKDGNDKEKKTHFDASHRHTVRWNLSSLDKTSQELKAVIRNTLLGDAQ